MGAMAALRVSTMSPRETHKPMTSTWLTHPPLLY